MSTKAIREALEFWAENCPDAPAGIKAKAGLVELEAIEKDVKRADKVRRIVWSMFDDGAPLDPYPTSDTSPEYRLRKLTRWKPKRERTKRSANQER